MCTKYTEIYQPFTCKQSVHDRMALTLNAQIWGCGEFSIQNVAVGLGKSVLSYYTGLLSPISIRHICAHIVLAAIVFWYITFMYGPCIVHLKIDIQKHVISDIKSRFVFQKSFAYAI